MRRPTVTLALALIALAAFAPGAAAAPDCTVNAPSARTLASGLGKLESAIVDRRGRLYFTSVSANGQSGALMKMRRRTGSPRSLVEDLPPPGGLALHRSGDLLLGFGNSILGGTTGTLNPQAGLLRVDRFSGETRAYADGLAMANGVAKGPDGTVYASDDFGIGIDRIDRDRAVQNAWASVTSSNGLVVDRRGRWLYAAQTFQPAAIQRVEIADPSHVEPFFTAGPGDFAAGFDGMTRDRRGNLFVAANGSGELWRIGRDGSACILARGLSMPSAVARGRGKSRFRRGNLYVVGFGGQVVELRNALRARP